MTKKADKPLADRMRPLDFPDFLGQEEIVGSGKLLRQAIENDSLPSIIFWGPPGAGKTTLAQIIARKTKANFVKISAVTSGLADLKEIIKRAEMDRRLGRKTILFVDEIHRWNKAQQDALLPHVENGSIIFIGATTENPSFEVRSALLSRCRVLVLKPLGEKELAQIIKRSLADKENGLGGEGIKIEPAAVKLLARLSNGDARVALNILEYAGALAKKISAAEIKEATQKSHLRYDKNGEEHYNIISALHKSLRGSDADAALYWLARMLQAGEDPLYVARRLVRFSSEDVGLANSRALEQAVAAFRACELIGPPECHLALAQAVVYLAKCEKSNELYTAYALASEDARALGNLSVPLHLRNAPTGLMKDLGYGRDYKYSPDHQYREKQEYFPSELAGKRYLGLRKKKGGREL